MRHCICLFLPSSHGCHWHVASRGPNQGRGLLSPAHTTLIALNSKTDSWSPERGGGSTCLMEGDQLNVNHRLDWTGCGLPCTGRLTIKISRSPIWSFLSHFPQRNFWKKNWKLFNFKQGYIRGFHSKNKDNQQTENSKTPPKVETKVFQFRPQCEQLTAPSW